MGGDHSEYKREQSYSDYSGFEGLSMDGPFVDYGSPLRPQRSNLNDRTLHQDEIQLPEVTDLEVVGVEDFELLRPVGLKENQPNPDVDHGIRQEALWDQEDYLRGVQEGVDCQEEEQLPHLEEVHAVEMRREPEVRRDWGRGRQARRCRQEANRTRKAAMEVKNE